MHQLSTSFLLGYHRCDRRVGEALLAGEPFKKSDNDYDWLGPGIYFWESNPRRAYEWAQRLKKTSNAQVAEPFVVGAVIDLGFCLDLLTTSGLSALRAAYASLDQYVRETRTLFPTNSGGEDLLQRRLDCAVIRRLDVVRQEKSLQAFESVRGVFLEGSPIYPGAGFRDKTHIQIAVIKPAMIKGVFRVKETDWR